MFRLDYCIPRYVITRELGMDKLKIGWGIRVKRFEERVKNREGSLVELCWKEKEEGGGKDKDKSEENRGNAMNGGVKREREREREGIGREVGNIVK